jgi:hypothetical protein
VTMYVNGAVKGTAVLSGSLTTTSGILALGRAGNATSQFFTGLMADLRLYSRALSSAEVSALYAVGS